MIDHGRCAFCGGVIRYDKELFVSYATKQDGHLSCYERAQGKLPEAPARPTPQRRT
jgi:hypothetical protein